MINNIVYVVETTYKNGQHEVNAIYSNEDEANEFVKFLKEHDGTNDMWIDNVKVRDQFVLGKSADVETIVNDVLDGYKDDIDSGVASMVKVELINKLS